jgi:hypothetical protein
MLRVAQHTVFVMPIAFSFWTLDRDVAASASEWTNHHSLALAATGKPQTSEPLASRDPKWRRYQRRGGDFLPAGTREKRYLTSVPTATMPSYHRIFFPSAQERGR